MQLGHPHRQLLLRCTSRCYSVRTAPANNSDAIAASGTPASPRLKRPSASTFEGINIQNVVVPAKSASQSFHNKTNKPTWSHGSSDKSPDVRRNGQPDRHRGMRRDGGASSMSGWGDGLVSLSFSNRLKLHQKQLNGRDTGSGPRPQESQPWKQKSNQAQRPQMYGPRRGQNQQDQADDASQRHRRHGETEKSASAAAEHRGNGTSTPITDTQNTKPKAHLMTRPSSSSTFKHNPQSTLTSAAASPNAANSKRTKADPASPPSSTTTATNPTSSPERKVRLAVLSNTNLNELFRTDAPIAGISIPTSARARVRGVLERSGDYSRFLSPSAGMHENTLRLPALRTARHALATQRDVSLEQRRVALHIIERLVQPRREARP